MIPDPALSKRRKSKKLVSAKLKRRTTLNMYRRTLWRTRLEAAWLKIATWPVGKPARDVLETEAIRAMNKVLVWFPGGRGRVVLAALQRRYAQAWRQAQRQIPPEATAPPDFELFQRVPIRAKSA